MKIVLGSGSPRRREILTQAGIDFDVIVSDCEERITKTVPAEVVRELSEQKAEDVWDKAVGRYESTDDLMVIGADTIVAFDDVIFGKPADKEEAVRMLKALSGATHQVYTGVTVLTADKRIIFADRTDVTMYEVDDAEIERYAASGEPMDKAGAYAIQGGYARYIKSINGEYNNVVGFPVARMIYELKREGICI